MPNITKTTKPPQQLLDTILTLLPSQGRERANIDCSNKVDTAYQLQISLANVYCKRTVD